MEPSVYLAALRHDFCGIIANDCMPLGVGYMKAPAWYRHKNIDEIPSPWLTGVVDEFVDSACGVGVEGLCMA